MATKATQQVRVNTTRYLDEEGLEVLWDKIKEYVAENSVNIDGDEIDLTAYATKEYVEEALANIDTSDIDLSDFVTTEVLAEELKLYAKTSHKHSEYLTEHQDISNKADAEHTHSMSDITDYTAPDMTGYATESYVTNAINNAQLGGGDGSSVDLSVYALKTEVETALEGKADTKHAHEEYLTEHQDISGKADIVHTHTLSDVTDYVAPDLAKYATKEYVDDAIADIPTGGGTVEVDLSNYYTKSEVEQRLDSVETELHADNSCLRKIVNIDGNRVYTVTDVPAIPTYEGKTVLTFDHDVIMRVLINNEETELLEKDYVEYSGSTITLENTSEGELTDYIIYNIIPSSEGEIEDPNILTINENVDTSLLQYKPNGYGRLTSGASVYKLNDTDLNKFYDFREAKIVSPNDCAMPTKTYTYDEMRWWAQDWVTERTFDWDKDSEDWQTMLEYSERYGKLWSENSNDETFSSVLPEAKNIVRPKTPFLTTCMNNQAASDALEIVSTKTGSKALIVRAVKGETFTIESLDKRPFAVQFYTAGHQNMHHFFEGLHPVFKKVDESVSDENATYVIAGYYDEPYTQKVAYLNSSGRELYDYPEIPLYGSADGTPITVTVDYTPQVSIADTTEDQMIILCESDEDYKSLRITSGSVSYTDIIEGNKAIGTVTVSNGEEESTTVSFDMYTNTAETDYVRYLDENIYHRYDLDDYYTKEEVDEIVSNSGNSSNNNAGSSGDSTGGGIAYSYNTEIATGDTYFDGRPIYLRIFHVDPLTEQPSNNISYRNYHTQEVFCDRIIECSPRWIYEDSSSLRIYSDPEVVLGATGTSASAIANSINSNVIHNLLWVTAYQSVSSNEFHITVGRGKSNYLCGCDVFIKYVK